MKTRLKITVGAAAVAVCSFALLASCGVSVTTHAQPTTAPRMNAAPHAPSTTQAVDELNRTIREVSSYLNERIPQGDKVAFVSAQQSFPMLAQYIIENLIENAVNDRSFTVIDRAQLDAVRAELQFQTSGEVSDESVRSLGRIVGAKTIVTVAISQIGNMYRFGIRALEVESAEIRGQINRNVSSGQTIDALAGASAPASTTSAQTRTTPTTAQSAATPAVAPVVAATSSATTTTTGNIAELARAEQLLLETGSLVLDKIEFQPGRDVILNNSLPYLRSIAQMLVKYPRLRIEIGGHTDNTGSHANNMRLSQQRAEAVLLFLVQTEPALAQMLTTKGYGPDNPVASNATPAGREQNRRIELKILKR